MSGRDFDQRRQLLRALGNAELAPRLEAASRRHRMQRRHSPLNRPKRRATIRLEIRHRVKQSACIRMRWSLENILPSAQFH
jgi:phage replication-related protein YjqB (UPF0714/DUF867 family)